MGQERKWSVHAGVVLVRMERKRRSEGGSVRKVTVASFACEPRAEMRHVPGEAPVGWSYMWGT